MATAYDASETRVRRLPAALRAPLEGRTWREFLYLLLNLPMALVMFVFAVSMTATGLGLLVTFLGIPVLAAALAGCRALGAVERGRARTLLDLDVGAPAPVRPETPGMFAWVGALLKSGVSWRHLLYAVVHFPWAVFGFSVAVSLWASGWSLLLYPVWFWFLPDSAGPSGIQLYGDGRGNTFHLDTPFEILLTGAIGLLVVMATPWVFRGMTMVDRGLVGGLLGPSRLAARVSELESGRGTVVDTAAADLRRIERDLHDGAQARLVALAMDLGLAREKLLEDPQAAAKMVDEAHGEVKTALRELRDLARGIHPAILTDRGLGPALSHLAARCTVPVTVTTDLPHRPAPAIEGIAYFTVSELLQNISKHSGARRATVDIWRAGGRLMLQVSDDGTGGATAAMSADGPAPGTGLAGLAERVEAVDGVLAVDSPAGRGTVVTAELPWRD
ncbi:MULTISPECIES: sensor histidine kinase [Streptomyces]|uniref:histidine kinase n=2 Tax=Streptomyces TaxID=1883 RepID=A0A3R7HEE7_9ACTN|nr:MULTISPECIES: sensor histidine kinase [Streptomyces]KNE80688.1 histidine kinase [Streptomyces fradiae]OFA44049.1 histidine kinase [Streptomyces fradiae]PQM21483.1 histidine kinase [Streptomyces xinghaiensis]RKM94458.1 sensor histidine kinase [Streptomyces xinghaiensis]RNC72057.1 sensor histidine kinase [Streptomyces xinghaiensis]